jgi:hypothetical protein
MIDDIIEKNNTTLTKNEFIENIKNWIVLDNQLKIVNEKTKKMREMKNQLNDSIAKYMNESNLSKNKIGISDGELRLCEKKEYSPLTYGYIENRLEELITDKAQVQYIIKYLKEKREITTSFEIKRTYKGEK